MTLSSLFLRFSISAVLRALVEAIQAAWRTHQRLFDQSPYYRALIVLLARLLLCELRPGVAWPTLLHLLADLIRNLAD